MACTSKAKVSFYKDKVIYADNALTVPISDAISDYISDKGEGKGLILQDQDNNPFFFQTDLNTQIIATLDALIEAFDVTITPTSAYEVALDTNLKAAKVKLENIKDLVP